MKVTHKSYPKVNAVKGIDYCWDFTVEHNGENFNGFIQYYAPWGENGTMGGYYIGYLWNDKIRRRWANSQIIFGYSNVRNNVKYILEAIKEVVNGDYTNVEGVGHYVHRKIK